MTCDYVDTELSGRSPKFTCAVAKNDEVKVKYGGGNGEAFAEVAATRLLWALGFGADRMYPVKVVCRGCPSDLAGGTVVDADTVSFEVAAIERKIDGLELVTQEGEGWSWPELDLLSLEAGGASRAHRDGLKLLAVFLQHTDSKPQQQRLICLGAKHHDRTGCARPLMMLNDVGLTFGRANRLNTQATASANFDEWVRTPIWRDGDRCVGHLDKSITGTLADPVISEEGRRFLSGLLSQLSDAQIRDLFEVARFPHRGVDQNGRLSNGSLEDWVTAFKNKRDEIAKRRCAPAPRPATR